MVKGREMSPLWARLGLTQVKAHHKTHPPSAHLGNISCTSARLDFGSSRNRMPTQQHSLCELQRCWQGSYREANRSAGLRWSWQRAQPGGSGSAGCLFSQIQARPPILFRCAGAGLCKLRFLYPLLAGWAPRRSNGKCMESQGWGGRGHDFLPRSDCRQIFATSVYPFSYFSLLVLTHLCCS